MPEVKEVIIISKTHLDIGFTDMAATVKRQYLDTFLEKALEVAAYYKKQNGNRNYIWTVGSWLIEELLINITSDRGQALRQAIVDGDITWHALPFTMHCELNNEFMFRRALDISGRLDEAFGCKTTAAKMTDVPGHTKGIIAPLADNGVKLLHIGINPASAVVQLPDVFNWVDSNGKSIVVIYQKDYGDEYLLPDGNTLVCMDVTGDNLGPRTIAEMEEIYDKLEKRFPGANVRCGTLNEIAENIDEYKAELPVVTSELGDTWIHGVGTDPWKVSRFRKLISWREKFGIDKRFIDFDRIMLQISEHTWGMDEKTHCNEKESYVGEKLTDLQSSEAGMRFASSWQEQRTYLRDAVASLSNDLQDAAHKVLQECEIFQLNRSEYRQQDDKNVVLPWGLVKFLEDGAISLTVKDTERKLFQLWGEVFGKDEYDKFYRTYNRLDEEWVKGDFTKQGLPADLKYSQFIPQLQTVEQREEEGALTAVLTLSMPSSDVTGMPQTVEMLYKFYKNKPVIEFTVQLLNKFPARVAHAIHLDAVSGIDSLQVSKLNEIIDFADIAYNGARSLHAVDQNIKAKVGEGNYLFTSLSVPLVAVGGAKLLNFDNELPDVTKGFSYNLYNNIWGTNFPMWYGDDSRFDFTLTVN